MSFKDLVQQVEFGGPDASCPWCDVEDRPHMEGCSAALEMGWPTLPDAIRRERYMRAFTARGGTIVQDGPLKGLMIDRDDFTLADPFKS